MPLREGAGDARERERDRVMICKEKEKEKYRERRKKQTERKDITHLQLSWFREDVGLNEHHCNWHLRYPFPEPPRLKRQGELFVYMHQQMLAR